MSEIVLNSLDLELNDIKLVLNGGEELVISDVHLDVDNEKAVMKLPSPLEPGQVQLRLAFKGAIMDKMKGFYCSKYHRYVSWHNSCLPLALLELRPRLFLQPRRR